MCIIKNSLYQSHALARQIICPGDTVIDATMGNGNDTAFLAELVGTEGKVIAFDIQEKAVEKTRTRLEAAGLASRVQLVQDGHQNMDKYVTRQVRTVMFNLGYLPGGDHHIGTTADTTIPAIEKAMQLISLHGLVIIVVYYGGDSGFDEKEELLAYIRSIDCRKYIVMQTEFANQINCPPILVCIEKTA